MASSKIAICFAAILLSLGTVQAQEIDPGALVVVLAKPLALVVNKLSELEIDADLRPRHPDADRVAVDCVHLTQ